MSLNLGSTTIGSLYLGSTKIGEAYLGSTKVYGLAAPVDPYNPLGLPANTTTGAPELAQIPQSWGGTGA